MRIPEIKHVVILGCGGTGSYLAAAVARYLRSKQYAGDFTVIDPDTYSDNNLERQDFGTEHIGMNKAEYQASHIARLLPDFPDINYVDQYLTEENVSEIITEDTVVFNCTDNKAARKYTEDQVLTLNNAAHICCGNDQYVGQVQISYRKNGVQITPSIYVNVPAFNSTDDDRTKMSCEELAALPEGGQVICANMMAAALALTYFVQLTNDNPMFMGGTWLPNSGLWFNTLMGSFDPTDKKIPSLSEINKYKKESQYANV